MKETTEGSEEGTILCVLKKNSLMGLSARWQDDEYYASITGKQGNDSLTDEINKKMKPQDFTRIIHDNAQIKEPVYRYFGRESLGVKRIIW